MSSSLESQVKEVVINDSNYHLILDAFINYLQDIIVVKDGNGRVLLANPSACNWLKLPLHEVVGCTDRDLFPEFVAKGIEQTDTQVQSTNINTCYETQVPYPDSIRTLLTYKFPWGKDESLNNRGVITVSRDISEWRKSDADLREREEWYRALIELAPQIVWEATALGELRYINQYGCEFLGIHSPAPLSLTWNVLVDELDFDIFNKNFNEALSTSSVFECECRLRRVSDNELRWFSLKARPLVLSDNSIDKWVGVATDIHDQKESLRLRERLLDEATSARIEAEQANRIKDEFLAILSHELRSPLTPILGWAKLLKAGSLEPERAKKAIEIIERNASVQIQLIDDLLDIARILRGKLRLEKTIVDVRVVVHAAVEAVKLQFEEKRITLHVDVTKAPVKVFGDFARLQQVVWNLLSNALKFSNPNSEVKVSVRDVSGNSELTVSDNGCGIHKTFLSNVFNAFSQADSSTTRKFGGLGLGLSIVREVTSLHDGTVRALSEGEGKGATFIVSIPLMVGSIKSQPHLLSSEDFSSLEGVSVLVLEDDLDSRELLQCVLEKNSATVYVTSHSDEALQVLRRQRFDVIVSDIAMPHEDGYLFIDKAKRLFIDKALPFSSIALTAYASEEDKKRALKAGFNCHLAKPVSPKQLIQSIQNLLTNSLK
jgi:PAS domain S-box-containing protein